MGFKVAPWGRFLSNTFWLAVSYISINSPPAGIQSFFVKFHNPIVKDKLTVQSDDVMIGAPDWSKFPRFETGWSTGGSFCLVFTVIFVGSCVCRF